MTEEQIERWVEREMDALDRSFLTTAMTQEDYEFSVLTIDQTAHAMLATVQGKVAGNA